MTNPPDPKTKTPNLQMVPLCQRSGCMKPLHSMMARNYLWIQEPGKDPRQAVFCRECAKEIKSNNQ